MYHNSNFVIKKVCVRLEKGLEENQSKILSLGDRIRDDSYLSLYFSIFFKTSLLSFRTDDSSNLENLCAKMKARHLCWCFYL